MVATAGQAHAQNAGVAPNISVPATEVPWYQQFTTSTGLTSSITGQSENDRLLPPAWTLSQHWGVTVDVREATRIERSQENGRGDQAALGAYYQFTPSVRVGGEVSVEAPRRQGPSVTQRGEDEEPAAGVRLESAFRF